MFPSYTFLPHLGSECFFLLWEILGLGYSSRKELDKLWPIEYYPPIFIVLIEHGPAHFFAHCLWMLLHCNGRVKQFQQKSAKPKRLTGPLQKKLADH